MLGQNSVAAATAVVGYDLARDTTWQASGKARVLVAVGLRGSAAALDTKIDIFVGDRKVGEMYNDTTGAPNRDAMFRIGVAVPPHEEVHLFITDAPVTSPINVAVDFQE